MTKKETKDEQVIESSQKKVEAADSAELTPNQVADSAPPNIALLSEKLTDEQIESEIAEGRRLPDEKSKKRAPRLTIQAPRATIELPTAARQQKPFYHPEFAKIIAAAPDTYKRFTEKGKK